MSLRASVRHAAARVPRLALVLFAASGILLLIARFAADFPRLDEAGYPDSFMLYDALHFQKTGVLYRDPATPPFPSAIYSPMLYVLIGIPGRIVEAANPFLAPRILFFLSFIGCVALAGSITRALIPIRSAWLWAVLLASSIGTMPMWVLQLRSDFPGIAFSMLSIRLLLTRRPAYTLLAGAAAGMAFQLKITFVSAAVAGGLWLLATKRWRDFMLFAAAGAAVGFGLYAYFQLREPRTFSQVFSMSLAVSDYRGLVWLVLQTIREPVFILAVAAIPLVGGKRSSDWGLVISFALITLTQATLTAAHAGANINYFFEGLFAVTPLAVLSAIKMARFRWMTGNLIAAVFLTEHYTIPNLRTARVVDVNEVDAGYRLDERRKFEMLELGLRGHRVFSTVPRISLLLDAPIIIEPFFLSYSQRMGNFDSGPIRARIRAREFEAVVTMSVLGHYRTLPSVPADISAEIAREYLPFCSAGRHYVIHLPRDKWESSSLGARLKQLGCAARDTTALVPR